MYKEMQGKMETLDARCVHPNHNERNDAFCLQGSPGDMGPSGPDGFLGLMV